MSKTTFVDGDPVQGILGTTVTAAFLTSLNNHRHGGTAVDGDGALDYAIATGSANAYAVTLSPALAANIDGLSIKFKANFTNTGAATLNVNGIGAIALKKAVNIALAAGDLQSGQIYTACFDGTNYQVLEVTLAGLGAANLKLFMNAAANAAEWAAGFNWITFTRDIALTGGDVAYTGMGFKPSSLIAIAAVYNSVCACWGFCNPSKSSNGLGTNNAANPTQYGPSSGTFIIIGQGAAFGSAIVKSFDADGFTLTWAKTNSPSGTVTCFVFGFR